MQCFLILLKDLSVTLKLPLQVPAVFVLQLSQLALVFSFPPLCLIQVISLLHLGLRCGQRSVIRLLTVLQ